ncbi:MAG: Ig-like domain-containing protein, partial [Ginsengibacter sp.]
FTITAKATDNGGLVTSSDAVTVSVIKPNAAPKVSIISPANNATFSALEDIRITATATDVDGTISKVEFYNGTILLATEKYAKYSWTWNNVRSGTYIITAKTYDDKGSITVSAPVTILVKKPNVAPVVTLITPVSSANFTSSASVNISAIAADADGSISKVEFYNGTTLLAIKKGFPYSWDWQNVPAGEYQITAKATDNEEMVTTSKVILITVAENRPPVVAITSPSTSAIFEAVSAISISAVAADIDGSISRVEFYNGNVLLGTAYTSPYTINWENVPGGNYAITAIATDNGGKATSSSAITISVARANIAPTVAITSPNSLSPNYTGPVNIQITAKANDADGSIKKVEFYDGATLIKTENYAAYSWTWKNVPSGNHKITAKAYDDKGLVTTSDTVLITVRNSDGMSLARNAQQSISKDYSKDVNIKIGPSPASNVLSVFTNGIQKTSGLKISIFTMAGTMLKTYSFDTKNETVKVDVSSLKAGLYIIKLNFDDSSVYKQFEKQ